MNNSIQTLLSQNLTLRKLLHTSKSQTQSLKKQLSSLQFSHEDIKQQYTNLSQQYNKIQQKCKLLNLQLSRNTASFSSQIQQLKGLIENKENQLQNFQIKMIPSLDQDMMRVKLIAEMEQPFQQAIEKKEREISKLKDQIHCLRRQKEILEFSLVNKQKQLKREIQQNKQFYTAQIDRLSKQILHMSQKSNSTGKTDKQILKSYRNEIDQLRSAYQFHKNTQQQLRIQIQKLRAQRQKLLSQLAHAHAQKAIQLSINNNNTYTDKQVKQIKNSKALLQDELAGVKAQLQRCKNKIRNMQQQRKKLQNQYQTEIKDIKILWERERESLRNQVSDQKEDIRKMRQQKNKAEHQFSIISQKYKLLIINEQKLHSQVTQLRMKIDYNIHTNNQRHSQKILRQKIQRQIRQKIQREIRIKIQKQIRQQIENQGKRHNDDNKKGGNGGSGKKHQQSPKRQNDYKNSTEQIKILKQKISKLTSKLQFANRKILQLLKQKAQRGSSDTGRAANDVTDGRNRSISYSPEHDYHRVLLQHRDCSFVPMCPPVAVQHLHHQLDPFIPLVPPIHIRPF